MNENLFKETIKEIHEDLKRVKSDINKIINNSDGYHTFDELYEHRAILFAIICNQNKELAWKSYKHHDGTMYDDMFIVGMTLPNVGDVSYHLNKNCEYMFENIKYIDNAPEFTGYGSEDVINRLFNYFIRKDN